MPKYLNLENGLNNDICARQQKDLQNTSITNHELYNYFYTHDCKCELFTDTVLDNNLIAKDGYGYANACTVDADSELRYNSKLTHGKEKSQLCERWALGVPNINKGGLNANVESRLLSSDITTEPCNKLSEKSYIPYTFYNMVPCLENNIQNPEHIIENWTRGGSSTRQDMVSSPYLEKCGFKNDGKQWTRKD